MSKQASGPDPIIQALREATKPGIFAHLTQVAHLALSPEWIEALADSVRPLVEQAWMDGAFFYGGDAAEQWYFNHGGSDYNPHRIDTPTPTEPTR